MRGKALSGLLRLHVWLVLVSLRLLTEHEPDMLTSVAHLDAHVASRVQATLHGSLAHHHQASNCTPKSVLDVRPPAPKLVL